MDDDFMSVGKAMETIYELAEQNLLCDDLDELDRIDESLQAMAREQHEALAVAHDFIVNHLGDD